MTCSWARNTRQIGREREDEVVECRGLVVGVQGIDGGEHVGLGCKLAVLDEQERCGALADQLPIDVAEQCPLEQAVMVSVLGHEPLVVRR